ncbi:MAG: FIST N-terminal domain-containing protein [Synechococcaceae cyanobacterium]|nr:FIST N-terminal domain-containing protein [Synechococcaceae cyanobacterium]
MDSKATSLDAGGPMLSGAPASGRWVRVGSSLASDPETAVQQACHTLLEAGQPLLVLIFSSPRHDINRLAALVAQRCPEARVIGCSTSGELESQRSLAGGLCLWALGGQGLSVATGMGQGDDRGLHQAAHAAARCLEQLERRAHTVLILLADGLCGDQMEVVRGAYEVAGFDVPLVGGCAGDDLAMRGTTWQIFGRQVLSKAVVAAAISSDAPLGIGMSHCWQPKGEPLLVTGSDGTNVWSLDDRSALEVYLEAFQAPTDLLDQPEAFAAFASTRPLGLRRRDRVEIRFVAGCDRERRSLLTVAEVPQGGLAYLMQGDRRSVLQATEEACELAQRQLGERPACGMLLFDCIARRSVLRSDGDANSQAEMERIRSVIGDIPVAGFYTYGEIARTHGAGGFHNQTLVALALA